jgi:hypothetical protein
MTIQANAEMPKPDALVSDEGGNIIAAMFYFAPGEYYGEIAEMCGFECKSLRMEDDVSDDDPLWKRYLADEDVTGEWEPTIPAGWTFGDKSDTENGPVAIFIRPAPPRV